MSFLPRVGLTLLGALCLDAHPPAGTPTNATPTNDEIGYVALLPCTGACEASSAPRTANILLDRQTSQTIPMTADAWSPDGMTRLIGGVDILVLPVLGNTSVNLTNHPAHYWTPTWSPDGSLIAFASDRDGSRSLYTMKADGSDLVRVDTGIAAVSQPTWAPDSTRLAFTCNFEPQNVSPSEICVINVDGSGFARLSEGRDPDWSPDGTRIVFTTERYGGSELAFMNADGIDVTRVVPGWQAYGARWAPDGTEIAFVSILDPDDFWSTSLDIMSVDGTFLGSLGAGLSPVWRPGRRPTVRPVASFAFSCSGSTCTFDASGSSDSDGSVITYAWQFWDGDASGAQVTHTFTATHGTLLIVMDNDGSWNASSVNVDQPPILSFTTSCTGLSCTFDASASFDPDGSIAWFIWRFGDSIDGVRPAQTTHAYSAPGTYTVTLTASDQDGVTSVFSQTVAVAVVNVPPVASFVSTCDGLTCTFNASSSIDVDGTIASYAWNFGDTTVGTGVSLSHAYTKGGSYRVALRVTDGSGATGSQEQVLTVVPADMHIGDLDRQSTSLGNAWIATVSITVHDTGHTVVGNVVVTGSWTDGSETSCITTALGQCTASIRLAKKATSIRFQVQSVLAAGLTYKPESNHDPDGDSNGTSVTVTR